MDTIASIDSAWNIEIMNVDQFIRANRCFEVTSPFAHQPSSNNFDEDGLFSERIFGEVASQTRLVKHGWIRLNCHVFHPIIFQNLQSLKRFYVEIMSGRSYAVWNPEIRDFERAGEDEEGAQTGYSFFLRYFDQIQFNKNQSLKRNDKINILLKYRDRLFIDKCLVAPAGIRDMREEDGRMEKDSINSLYLSLMQNAKAMPPVGDHDSIYDVTHYAIQRKVVEIYEYLMNFISDKRGFLASKLGARSVVQGTRNVITATSLECSAPDSPQFHKVEEIKVPLYQAAKGFSSLVAYQIKSAFYAPIISSGQDQIPLINPESLSLEYVGINDKDKDYLLTTEGIMKTIDRFRDPFFRFRPVTATTASNKKYYLYLVYEEGERVYIFRNAEEFKLIMKSVNKEVDPLKIRPMTYAELIYIATAVASWGKSGTLTRYPIEDEGNIFPGLTHVMTTTPGRIVKLVRDIETDTFIELPEYPVIGGRFIDAVMIHPSRLKGLGADFDGNCLSGSTTIQIRFTPLWLEMISAMDYTISGQNVQKIVSDLKRDSFVYRVGTSETIYTTVRFDEMPQPGSFTVDKNGAHVFDLPPGCDVLSLKDGCPTWLPFTNITVEENCEYRKIVVGNHSAEVSTNPSVAVFDTKSGELIKVSPKDAEGKFAPYIDELICKNPENITKINELRPTGLRGGDLIPLSYDEKMYMIDLVEKFGDESDVNYFKYQDLETGFTRSMFFKFIQNIDRKSIKNRVMYWTTQWAKVKLDGEPTVGTVYDLLVPDSKVFAVNNGLIVYDTISWIPLFSDEASKQCQEYYNSKANYINTDGSAMVVTDDLCAITTHALTMEPKEGLNL